MDEYGKAGSCQRGGRGVFFSRIYTFIVGSPGGGEDITIRGGVEDTRKFLEMGVMRFNIPPPTPTQKGPALPFSKSPQPLFFQKFEKKKERSKSVKEVKEKWEIGGMEGGGS